MPKIKIANNDKELEQVFNFLSKKNYDNTLYKEKYYPMSKRLEEIKRQLKIDKDFLMYIEEDNSIVLAITSKNMVSKEKNNIWVLPSKRSFI